jgi:hypothetical protein
MLAVMKCPHCQLGIHASFAGTTAVEAGDSKWHLAYMVCPECSQPIIRVLRQSNSIRVGDVLLPAYPQTDSMRPVAPEVPNPYRQDFIEACAVLSISPKASAALSRRNLQAIIHDIALVKKKDLNLEIQAIIDSGSVPTYISESLHAVRHIGNFAAHPIKSTSTGEIVDVELGEAEWNLDALESMFDFYFVQPAITAKRKAELNIKLKDANKPLIP